MKNNLLTSVIVEKELKKQKKDFKVGFYFNETCRPYQR